MKIIQVENQVEGGKDSSRSKNFGLGYRQQSRRFLQACS